MIIWVGLCFVAYSFFLDNHPYNIYIIIMDMNINVLRSKLNKLK
jgi:hypothetical protein